jgi:hypothetical protein
MVSWSDLSNAIHKNTSVTFNVPHITLQTDVCKILVVTESVLPSVSKYKHIPLGCAELETEVTRLTPSNVIRTDEHPVSITLSPVLKVRQVEAAPSAVSKPLPSVTAKTETASMSIPRVSKTTVDPVVIGMEQIEPLYNSAPRLTKHQMEITEAQRLEALMNEVYAKESGRSRGWTKTGLEQMLKARCASGGDIKELERARVSFPWKLIRDDKLASAFLDFVCICKQIRVAVWDTESKIVALYPAADPVAKPAGKIYPLYHVSLNGELMFGGSDLIKLCDTNKFVLMPPLSVLKSLSGLTLDELANVATQLGMSGVEGNKAERVAKIASYKVRSRF